MRRSRQILGAPTKKAMRCVGFAREMSVQNLSRLFRFAGCVNQKPDCYKVGSPPAACQAHRRRNRRRCRVFSSRRPANRVSSVKYPAGGHAFSFGKMTLEVETGSVTGDVVIPPFSFWLPCDPAGTRCFSARAFKHFLIADAPADLMPASPVESRFVAVDSGHFCLLPFGAD